MARKQLSKRLRFRILERDGFCCVYCGASPPDCVLHVDHKLPVSKGGGNEESNLVAACRDCNAGKAAHESDEPRYYLGPTDDDLEYPGFTPRYVLNLINKAVLLSDCYSAVLEECLRKFSESRSYEEYVTWLEGNVTRCERIFKKRHSNGSH